MPAGRDGRDDGRFVDFSGPPLDNNLDVIAHTSVDDRHRKLFGSLAWKHMGERAGNITNVITLPRFNQFDAVDGSTSPSVNPGDRQSFTQLPSAGERTLLQFLPILPRAYYMTATYRF